MAQFRIELDRPMPHGTTVGMLSLLRGFIHNLPNCGHGPPNAHAAQGLNWADGLCRRGLKLANMAFTVETAAHGAAATMASLLQGLKQIRVYLQVRVRILAFGAITNISVDSGKYEYRYPQQQIYL